MLQGIIHEAGNEHQKTEVAMVKSFIPLAIMMVVLACGPEAGEEDDIPGELEYEHSDERLYRLGRRIDVVTQIPGEDGERRECGLLTDRAYDDLESTLAALDPTVDYGDHSVDCHTYGALVHVGGFEHSPFECTFGCCHRELLWATIVYTMALNNLDGITATIEGEPYVAIEPDQPCP